MGLGLDYLFVNNRLNFTSSAAGFFSLVIGVGLFFYGLVGYRTITRGITWQILGTLGGALFVTGIRALMGLSTLDRHVPLH